MCTGMGNRPTCEGQLIYWIYYNIMEVNDVLIQSNKPVCDSHSVCNCGHWLQISGHTMRKRSQHFGG